MCILIKMKNTSHYLFLTIHSMDTLKKNYEFRNVLSHGKYCSGKYIEVFIKKNNLNINRIGIAVSVKVAKAVQRNKIKRLIRENYRSLETNLKTGNDIVFLWKKKKPALEANFYNVKEDIDYIMKKSELLKEKQ